MTNPAANTTPGSAWDPKFPFDLVVVYEDKLTRNRALHLYDHLAQQLFDDYDFQCSWWKFEHLLNPTIRHQAAEAAVEANMVLLSLHARDQLTSLQQTWIDEWLPKRDTRKAALVALIAGGTESGIEKTPLVTYLQNAARLGGMDFFTHEFDIRQLQADSNPPETGQHNKVIATPNKISQQPMPAQRWGINE